LASGMTDRRRAWFSSAAKGGGWPGAAAALEGRNIVRVHVVVPEGFDDPGQPSGGNIYDRRAWPGLADAGWEVSVAAVAAACRVHVARPGVDRVAAPARPVRGHLICIGVLGRHKGQDLLVEALAELADRNWHCVLAGSLDRDPDFVEQLQTRISRLGYDHRV